MTSNVYSGPLVWGTSALRCSAQNGRILSLQRPSSRTSVAARASIHLRQERSTLRGGDERRAADQRRGGGEDSAGFSSLGDEKLPGAHKRRPTWCAGTLREAAARPRAVLLVRGRGLDRVLEGGPIRRGC